MSDDFEHQAEAKAGTVADWIKANPIKFWIGVAILAVVIIAAAL